MEFQKDQHTESSEKIPLSVSTEGLASGAYEGSVVIKVSGAQTQDINLTVNLNIMNTYALESGKNIGGVSRDFASDVKVDLVGNAYYSGTFWNQIQIDGQTLNADVVDAYLTKYNEKGKLLWIKQITGTDYQWIQKIFIDIPN